MCKKKGGVELPLFQFNRQVVISLITFYPLRFYYLMLPCRGTIQKEPFVRMYYLRSTVLNVSLPLIHHFVV